MAAMERWVETRLESEERKITGTGGGENNGNKDRGEGTREIME